jgi:hypothetical protein
MPAVALHRAGAAIARGDGDVGAGITAPISTTVPVLSEDDCCADGRRRDFAEGGRRRASSNRKQEEDA